MIKMVLVRAEHTFPFLQHRNFQEIGGLLLLYKDRMSSVECCVAPLGREAFERSMFVIQTESLVK